MLNKIKEIFSGSNILRFRSLININMIRNIFLFTGGIIIFIFGVILYGIILNLREPTLAQAMREKGFTSFENPNIIIDRKSYSLNLYEDSVLVKSYRANFGKNVASAKSKKNDSATPVGQYSICDMIGSHKYHKFLKINYPNLQDAAEALRRNIISQEEFNELQFEYYYEGCPSLETALGGNIGIHGIGEYNDIFKNLPFVYNWTDGSIAVSNESIDEIFSVVKKGTRVVIK